MASRKCSHCHQLRRAAQLTTAVIGETLHKGICSNCLNGPRLSGGSASYERRRGFEDNAQDTVQPYTATGPNPEFARLYPKAAARTFTKEEMEAVRRQL